MKPLPFFVGGIIASACFLDAGEATTVTDSFLSGLRREASRAHPRAAAAFFRADAARQEVGSVRLWDDPTVGLSLMAAEREMRRDDGDVRLMAEQPLPRPGLYEASRKQAEALHRAELENSSMAALETGAEAARNAIELALADESIAIQSEQIRWLKAITGNARQRSLNPGGNAVEALRLESELAREDQILDAAKRSRTSVSQRLNLSLGRPLESPWPALKLPASPPPVPVAVGEIARIPHANPRVRAMRETAAAANAEVRVTERERQPGVSVGVETDLYSGGDFRSSTLGLKVTLPWFNEPSYRAKTNAARSREAAAVEDIEATRRETAGAVLSAVTEAANAAAQARAYSGDIKARAEEATRATEAAWISSTSTLVELLEANRALFSIRLEQRRFIAMQQAALEELNLLVPNR